MGLKVYISGALTSLDDASRLKAFYEEVAKLCASFGMEPYLPHKATDPVQHPDITAVDVYATDERRVSECDLVIAYVGIPSLGVGAEIEIAKAHQIPVVLLYETGKPISRLIRGNPAVIARIRFTSFEDAVEQLKSVIQSIIRKDRGKGSRQYWLDRDVISSLKTGI